MRVSLFLDKNVIECLPNLLDETHDVGLSSKALTVAAAFDGEAALVNLLASDPNDREKHESKLLHSFYNNLTLLVQKTWVEKSDETLKEQVYYRLEKFKSEFLKKNYPGCYKDFLCIIRDVFYLMFGLQSSKEDFLDYALRIDPGLGIFWWYFSSLPGNVQWSAEKSRVMLLLGMYFIANY